MGQLFPGQVFPFGQLCITRTASEVLDLEDVSAAIRRHGTGDWGELDDEDKTANDDSLLSGLRLLSSYRNRSGVTFWIITEADRSVTTVLLPGDY